MKKLIIIDGNSLINRAFYALPLLTNSNGEYSNAVYGFCNMLIKMIIEHKPDHLIVAFDYGKKNFRHNLYAEYKGTRKGTPDELKSQFPLLKKVLREMNITLYEQEGIEADDIIGTLAKKFDEQTYILTGDRDALQLIDETTSVWLTHKGISEIKEVDIHNIYEFYSLKPSQIIDFKALSGDSSDNIPGVKGIGEKTAINLLQQYNNIENLYQHTDELKGAVKTKIENGKDMAFLSKKLATIDCNANINIEIDDCVYDFPFNENVYALFKEYNFNSLIRRQDLFLNDIFNISETDNQQEFLKPIKAKKIVIKNELEFDHVFQEKSNEKLFSFIISSDKINFAFNEKTEYEASFELSLFNDAITLEKTLQKVSELCKNPNIEKVTFGVKQFLRRFKDFNIEINNLNIDADIAYYLIEGGQKSTLEKVIYKYGDISFPAVTLISACTKMKQELKNLQLEKLYFEIELPLTFVLLDMEETGFKIDRDMLNEQSQKYNQEIAELQQKIYEVAECEFNLNSPKQLADVLFNKLGLSTKGNKKQSTNVDVLNSLVNSHPIIPLILRYRTVSKLVSTYIDGFKEILPEDNIIHTIFNQTLTSTGRLSSSEPNLQNIPVKTEEGKQLRALFVSRFENGNIVSADYSQVELRLMAHLSNDENLIKAFNMGKDIHSAVACEVFGVSSENVTPLMRRQAKAINFGIIYGISMFGLGDNMGISAKQAQIYMQEYFNKYPNVKLFMDKCIETCKTNNGETRTMFNRIRKIPDIFSTKATIRAFGERASLNAPIQGTASDIIKIAMINVYNRIKKENLKSKLVLQIHDELILDVPENELEIAKTILKEEMQNAVHLSVPLTCDVGSGVNWFECK